MQPDRQLAEVRSWAAGGRVFHNENCWEFVQEAFRVRDVELPEDPWRGKQKFRDLREDETPEPWDVAVVKLHKFLVCHVALVIDNGQMIQLTEQEGVHIVRYRSQPWSRLIVGYMRYVG